MLKVNFTGFAVVFIFNVIKIVWLLMPYSAELYIYFLIIWVGKVGLQLSVWKTGS